MPVLTWQCCSHCQVRPLPRLQPDFHVIYNASCTTHFATTVQLQALTAEIARGELFHRNLLSTYFILRRYALIHTISIFVHMEKFRKTAVFFRLVSTFTAELHVTLATGKITSDLRKPFVIYRNSCNVLQTIKSLISIHPLAKEVQDWVALL